MPTEGVWELSAALGPVRLLALALLSVGAVSATLVIGAGLWERARGGHRREQVMLFNMATTATVLIGCWSSTSLSSPCRFWRRCC